MLKFSIKIIKYSIIFLHFLLLYYCSQQFMSLVGIFSYWNRFKKELSNVKFSSNHIDKKNVYSNMESYIQIDLIFKYFLFVFFEVIN